jgi:hypothetical protein
MVSAAASFCDHRARILGARKRGWRLGVRIVRMKSAASELRQLAKDLESRVNRCPTPKDGVIADDN